MPSTSPATARRGRPTLIALAFAAGWSVLLIVGGFVVPLYQGESSTSSGAVTGRTTTLVAVNGTSAVVVLSIPLVVTALVAAALLASDRRGLPVAWTLTVLLGAFTALAMLTIGVFVLPVTAALVVACAATTRARAAG